MGRPIGKPAGGRVVELRIRLDAEAAKRLGVVAAVRGVTASEVVGWALLPHLSFDLPEIPDVSVGPIITPRLPGGEGGGRSDGQA